jgi:hypothetical protein
MLTLSDRIAQVVECRPLDREVRGSNPSHDTMALLMGRHYEFPQCGIIKEKLLLLLLFIPLGVIPKHLSYKNSSLLDKMGYHLITPSIHLDSKSVI